MNVIGSLLNETPLSRDPNFTLSQTPPPKKGDLPLALPVDPPYWLIAIFSTLSGGELKEILLPILILTPIDL